jgi:uncharacterized protein with PQ loop repeat
MKKLNLRSLLKRPKKVPKGQHLEPLHHYHVRKRVHHWYQDYPHPEWKKRFLDRGVFIIGALGPLVTLPQLYTLWSEKDPGGLSLFTWISYIFIASFWITYGLAHQERPIVFTYSCWILIHLAMVSGIIMYS